MAGVFNIIAGALSLAWALLMVIEVFAVASGALDEQFTDPDQPPKEVMIVVFAVMFFLSAAGGLQVWGGVALLKRARNARGVGMAAAITSLASIWNCCLWPLCAAAGIYTLVILQKREVIDLLSGPRY